MLGKLGNIAVSPPELAPGGLSGIVAWWRADSLTTLVSGNISSWGDLSGNGNTISQATAGSRPGYSSSDVDFGGQPAGLFAGGYLTTAAALSTSLVQPFSIFLIAKDTSAGAWIVSGDIASEVAMVALPSQSYIYAGAFGCTDHTANDYNPASVACGIFNGATSAFYVNDSQTARATGDSGSNGPTTHITLGARSDGAIAMSGAISECAIFSGGLTASQRALLFSYAALRYGITAS